MKFIRILLKAFALVLSLTMVFVSGSNVIADESIEYTPLASQSILHGLVPKMGSMSSNNYNFKAWAGASRMEHLTDGILSRNGLRDEVVAKDCPIYSANGTEYYFVYELDAYYDITSVAVWADISRGQYYIDRWEVYAAETIADLLEPSSCYVGKKSGTDEYDKQIATLYRKVKYIAFALGHENSADLNIRINEFEAFGKLSADQNPTPTSESVSLKGDSDIDISAKIDWEYKNQNDNAPKDLVVSLGDAISRKSATEALDYYYKVYETLDVSMRNGDGNVKNTDMNNKFDIIITIPDKLKNQKNLMLATIGEGYAEIIVAEADNGKFEFSASNTEKYAFVVPNFEENATLKLTEDYYPTD